MLFTDNIDIREAQSWYEQNKPSGVVLKSAIYSGGKLNARPSWEHAFKNNHKGYKTVEVPLTTLGRFGFATLESQQAFEQTNDHRYMESLTRLIIKTESKSNSPIGFLMTIIPDKDYRDENDFRAFYSAYKKWQKNFSGCIMYHTMEGNFANGWILENGIVTKTLEMDGGVGIDIDIQLKSIINCTDYYTLSWFRDCTDYFTATETGTTYNGTICSEPYAEYVLIGTICEYTEAGSGGSGGGGGYTPPTTTNVDPIYDPQSTLNSTQKDLLEIAVTEYKELHLEYSMFYNKLVSMGIDLKFGMDNSLDGYAAYFSSTEELKFLYDNCIKEANIAHEFLHVIQHQEFYGIDYDDDIPNYEFEVRVALDYIRTINGRSPIHGLAGKDAQIPADNLYIDQYVDWIVNVSENNGFTVTDEAIFNSFCNQWNYYPGTVDPTFTPELLNFYFEGVL